MTRDDSPNCGGGAAAFEILGDPGSACPFVFTCEHASDALPEWRASEADAAALAQHFGWDIGAGDLTRALAARLGSAAVLSRFSRLVCDPNRHSSEPDFVVCEVEGRPLSFNAGLAEGERERRNRRYAEAYHGAVDAVLRARRSRPEPVQLGSVHSFTPIYKGQRRAMEIGVLFDAFEESAHELQRALQEEGFEVVLNAPYSGYDGLIYAARRHGRAHELVYWELEVRQDLIDDVAKAGAVAERIARALERIAAPQRCATPAQGGAPGKSALGAGR